MSISAVILTKNSSKTILSCLKSLAWCDEILVIDDNSTDSTSEIAINSGTKVVKRNLDNNFSDQRNFGLERAKGNWVLFIDSDEIVPFALKQEIETKIEDQSNTKGYYIKRVDNIWGKEIKHGEMGDMWLLRLGKKGAGKWSGKVHEIWNMSSRTGKLNNIIMHYPHPNISSFLRKINFYTTLRAKELYDQRRTANWLEIIFYPKAKFIQNYFFKLGFVDGLPGLVIAILMSFHSFLVRAKLWQLNQQKKL